MKRWLVVVALLVGGCASEVVEAPAEDAGASLPFCPKCAASKGDDAGIVIVTMGDGGPCIVQHCQ